MYRKFSQLSFIIGAFFFLVSLILAGNAVLMRAPTNLNHYTAIAFFLFGLFMMLLKNNEAHEPE